MRENTVSSINRPKLKNAPCKTKKVFKNEKKYVFRRRMVAGIAAGMAVAALGATFSGVQWAENKIREANKSITYEQSLEAGMSYEDLGIDKSTVKELQKMKKLLDQKEIKDNDMIDVGTNLEQDMLYTVKSKISKATGTSEANIKLTPGTKYDPAMVSIFDNNGNVKEIYQGGILSGKSIDSKIVRYIGNIADVQEANQDIIKGEFNRNEVIKTYKEGIDNTTKLILYKIKKDSKGDIVAKKITKDDLKNIKNPKEER